MPPKKKTLSPDIEAALSYAAWRSEEIELPLAFN